MSKASDLMLDLRKKSVEELLQISEDRRAELFALRFQAAVGSLEQTHKIKEIKKIIARIEMLLNEHKKSGSEIKTSVKADYNKAVSEAEKAGKEVRAKHMKMMEELQSQQYGSSAISEDAIAQAMAATASESTTEEVVEVKPTVAAKKPATTAKTPAAAKPTEVKKETKTSETKPAAAKKPVAPAKKPATTAKTPAAAKPTEVKKPTTAAKKPATTKPKTSEPKPVEKAVVKGTGKGKASVGETKPKSIDLGKAINHDVDAIELKLKAKEKNAKSYVYGSNVEEAKKQIEEQSKKTADKKGAKK